MENKDVGFSTFLFAIIPTSLYYHLHFEARTDFERWRTANHSLASSNERLKNRVAALENENEYLREDLRDYKLLRKVFGSRQIDNLLEQARANKGKRRDERSR